MVRTQVILTMTAVVKFVARLIISISRSGDSKPLRGLPRYQLNNRREMMTDTNGTKTVKEKAILEQLAATGLQTLHYYEGNISVTLLLARTGPLTLTRDGEVIEGGGELLVVARGIAICSVRDQFSRKEGRLISLGRALKAYRSQSSSKEVVLRENYDLLGAAVATFGKIGPIKGDCQLYQVYKSCWLPVLTEQEQALLKMRLRDRHEQQQQV